MRLIAFSERGRTGFVLNKGRVLSAPAHKDGFVGALLEAHHRAEDDRMGVALDDLLDEAVEGRDRIGEQRSAG